jgi:hypothetical protein
LPNHEEHCADSLRRYGKTYSEVHRWMDEPCKILGSSHRIYRHDPFVTPREAKAIFGDLADHVTLDHIRLDEQESNRKQIDENVTQLKMIETPFCLTVNSSAKVLRFRCIATTIMKGNRSRFSYKLKKIMDTFQVKKV